MTPACIAYIERHHPDFVEICEALAQGPVEPEEEPVRWRINRFLREKFPALYEVVDWVSAGRRVNLPLPPRPGGAREEAHVEAILHPNQRITVSRESADGMSTVKVNAEVVGQIVHNAVAGVWIASPLIYGIAMPAGDAHHSFDNQRDAVEWLVQCAKVIDGLSLARWDAAWNAARHLEEFLAHSGTEIVKHEYFEPSLLPKPEYVKPPQGGRPPASAPPPRPAPVTRRRSLGVVV